MIKYVEKGIGLHDAIRQAGHWLEQMDGQWVASNDQIVQKIIDEYVEKPNVPQVVTFRQAKQELIVRGKWGAVLAAVDAIQDPIQRELMKAEVMDSQVYERNRPQLIAMAKNVLGMTDAQIDELFIAAAQR